MIIREFATVATRSPTEFILQWRCFNHLQVDTHATALITLVPFVDEFVVSVKHQALATTQSRSSRWIPDGVVMEKADDVAFRSCHGRDTG